MKPECYDITSRINEKPKWYDVNGVPRYEEFHPKLSGNSSNGDIVLAMIMCPYCIKTYVVEVHGWAGTPYNEWRYGSQPYHACKGDTMQTRILRVLQVWQVNFETYEWERISNVVYKTDSCDALMEEGTNG